MVDKEKIYFFRHYVMPVALSWMANDTYGSVGEHDREDFEKDFNEILDLAQSALEDDTLFDAISREKAIGVINDGRLTKLIDADVAIDSIKRLPHVKPEITQDQLEEYCKKRCLTVITDDLLYKLTSGSENTATWESCGEFWEHRSGLEKFKCNRCGGEVILYFGAKYPNFCPYCGRKSITDTGYERKIEDNGYGFMLITGRRKGEV